MVMSFGMMGHASEATHPVENAPQTREPCVQVQGSIAPPQTPWFDHMHTHLYQIANKPVQTKRKKYRRGALELLGGGLSESDRELLASMYFNSSSVFEFGLGESTHIAAHVGVPRYSGVDSVSEWVGIARDGAKMDHFRFSFADIGSTKSFGNPVKADLKKIPLDYQSAPLNNEMKFFDTYLVDGRYRVACACASFLHAMSRGGDMSRVTVAVHDWTPVRSFLFVLKDIADIKHQSEHLVALILKPNVTEHEVFEMWERHMLEQG